MRIRVVVELDVEPLEPLMKLNTKQVGVAVEEAVMNAMEYAQGEGHKHILENEISIILAAVHTLKD